MINNLSAIIYMDGNGLYVWACLLVLILILGINIYLPSRRLKKIYKENKTNGL